VDGLREWLEERGVPRFINKKGQLDAGAKEAKVQN
jgi:hypothetical protein